MKLKNVILIPVVTAEGNHHKFVLDQDFQIKLAIEIKGYYKFYHAGNLWGTLCDGVLTIKRGYAWNGCSFVPDTKKTLVAGLIHDFMYQFSCGDAAWCRAKADELFYIQLEQERFIAAKLYYIGVHSLGWAFYGKEKETTYDKTESK